MVHCIPHRSSWCIPQLVSVFFLVICLHYSNIRSREELKEAQPKPGGFWCALEKEMADMLFYKLALNGKVVWVSKDK